MGQNLLGKPDDARAVGERGGGTRATGRLSARRRTQCLCAHDPNRARRGALRGTLEEAIRAYREAGDANAIVPTASLAETHYATGSHAAALACGLQVVAMTSENRDHANLASALANVAAYALTVDDAGQADGAAHEALELLAQVGETRVATMCCLQHLRSVAARGGFYARAARLAGASNGLYRAFGLEREFTEQSLYDRTLAQVTAGIGMTAAQQHLDAGAALPIQAAITQALEPVELHVSM